MGKAWNESSLSTRLWSSGLKSSDRGKSGGPGSITCGPKSEKRRSPPVRPQDPPPNLLRLPRRLPHLPQRPPRLPESIARAAGFRLIAGVDEAGRGPWAGPVVGAAVVLPHGWGSRRARLPVRIDDSKALTARQRDRAFECILRCAQVGVGLACAEEIDQRNILQATLLAMARAIGDLPIHPELILVDGPAAPHVEIPCWPVIHGDAVSRVIACASIVAKVTRDRLMRFYHRLLPHYAFDEHKGYGTSRHRLALTQWGPSLLHRLSFRPVTLATRPAAPPSPPFCFVCAKQNEAVGTAGGSAARHPWPEGFPPAGGGGGAAARGPGGGGVLGGAGQGGAGRGQGVRKATVGRSEGPAEPVPRP